MSTPVYVTFRRMTPRAELEAYAREQASRLERFYSRIVDCRVLLEPNGADVLRVVVEVTVPGERLVASYEYGPSRGATQAGRHALAEHRWLHALHEAFDSAARILRTYAGQRLDRARQDASLS